MWRVRSNSGLLFCCRKLSRSAAVKPLISRSMTKSASRRLTASSAIGEIGLPFLPSRAFFAMSASSKNFRLACARQNAGVIGSAFVLRIEQRLEAVVAVRLDDSTEPGQMFLWMLTNIGSRYAPNLGKPAKRIAEIAVHRIHNAGGFAELGAPSLLSIGIDKFGACFDVLEKSGEVATKAKRVL